eukprot:gene39809-52548_t
MRATAAAVGAALTFSGCLSTTGGTTGSNGNAAGDYAQSCLKGAALGGLAGAAANVIRGISSGKSASESLSGRGSDLLKAAAAGCVIGLAVTAIGKLMTAQQQAKHEQAMQREAKRRADEAARFGAQERQIQARTVRTPADIASRDAELAKARTAFQTSIAKPTTVDLGEGGQSTILVTKVPAPTAPATPGAGPGAEQCSEWAVETSTSAGKAKQYELWCPNAQ